MIVKLNSDKFNFMLIRDFNGIDEEYRMSDDYFEPGEGGGLAVQTDGTWFFTLPEIYGYGWVICPSSLVTECYEGCDIGKGEIQIRIEDDFVGLSMNDGDELILRRGDDFIDKVNLWFTSH